MRTNSELISILGRLKHLTDFNFFVLKSMTSINYDSHHPCQRLFQGITVLLGTVSLCAIGPMSVRNKCD